MDSDKVLSEIYSINQRLRELHYDLIEENNIEPVNEKVSLEMIDQSLSHTNVVVENIRTFARLNSK